MLASELIRKIRRIHITTGRAVDAVMAGHYRSAFRGSGIEFEEFREYSPGDEIKSIDWKVTARLGRPFIKRFREERELTIMLLVDMSASGGFGTAEALKRETMVETAAIIAFNAIRSNDKVGAVLFTDRIEKYIPPKKGSGHVWRVLKELISFTPERTGTDIAAACGFAANVARKKTVSFVISDFMCQGYEPALRRFSRRHDCVAAVVSDAGDFSLPMGGLFQAMDPETGERVLLDCSDRATREAYENASRARYEGMLKTLKRAKVDYMELNTSGDASGMLYAFFRRREKRFRA